MSDWASRCTPRLDAALLPATFAFARQFVGYFAISLAALALDLGLFFLLHRCAGLHYLVASAISFSSGAAVTYLLSIRLVFDQRRIADGRVEFASFFLIGLLGLSMNQVALWVGASLLAWPALYAKLAAAGISFIANFIARRTLLFTVRQSR